jgi:diphosphomevalonate decarboxylase
MQLSAKWESPSNIALVKYWGKKGVQLPSNPSISLTLNEAKTITQVSLEKKVSKNDFDIQVLYNGIEMPEFEGKIIQFLNRTHHLFTYTKEYKIVINTINTFPHSSGIASSASGMSALALCLCSLEEQIEGNKTLDFMRKASIAARLGSGSACRSLYGGLVSWGEHKDFIGSSDDFATQLDEKHVFSGFYGFMDLILLVDEGQKKVSSSLGHSLLENHPFAPARFAKANENMTLIKQALKDGDLGMFTKVVEGEAMMLHAMMMTSNPYFILMRPNTLKIIEKVWDFRKETGLHPIITLDAGANVHILFPQEEQEAIMNFAVNELLQYCEENKYICSTIGDGPKQL